MLADPAPREYLPILPDISQLPLLRYWDSHNPAGRRPWVAKACHASHLSGPSEVLPARNLSFTELPINQRCRINVHANILQKEEIIELNDWWILLPNGDVGA